MIKQISFKQYFVKKTLITVFSCYDYYLLSYTAHHLHLHFDLHAVYLVIIYIEHSSSLLYMKPTLLFICKNSR